MINRWPTGADVYVNPANDPTTDGFTEAATKYGCWSVQERTGIELRYKGLTTETQIDGAIILKWGTEAEFKKYGKPNQVYFTTRGLAARQPRSDKTYKWAKLFLNTLYQPKSPSTIRRVARTVLHELLHGVGAEHLPGADAVMNPIINSMHPATYGLTGADFTPVQRGGNHTFIELTREYDLFIPRLQNQTVDLEYIGDESIHRWKLRRLSPSGESCPESAAIVTDLQNPDILMTDVRGPDMRFNYVELIHDPINEWWTLAMATFQDETEPNRANS